MKEQTRRNPCHSVWTVLGSWNAEMSWSNQQFNSTNRKQESDLLSSKHHVNLIINHYHNLVKHNDDPRCLGCLIGCLMILLSHIQALTLLAFCMFITRKLMMIVSVRPTYVYSTQAIHLDLTISLSVNQFLLAFRRFVGRRSLPATVWLDNAKTFKINSKGATKDHEVIKDATVHVQMRVDWKFIDDCAPWWEGFGSRW